MCHVLCYPTWHPKPYVAPRPGSGHGQCNVLRMPSNPICVRRQAVNRLTASAVHAIQLWIMRTSPGFLNSSVVFGTASLRLPGRSPHLRALFVLCAYKHRSGPAANARDSASLCRAYRRSVQRLSAAPVQCTKQGLLRDL